MQVRPLGQYCMTLSGQWMTLYKLINSVLNENFEHMPTEILMHAQLTLNQRSIDITLKNGSMADVHMSPMLL